MSPPELFEITLAALSAMTPGRGPSIVPESAPTLTTTPAMPVDTWPSVALGLALGPDVGSMQPLAIANAPTVAANRPVRLRIRLLHPTERGLRCFIYPQAGIRMTRRRPIG
ncbi:hypothetical protein D3C72_1306350 [compost metagenome]